MLIKKAYIFAYEAVLVDVYYNKDFMSKGFPKGLYNQTLRYTRVQNHVPHMRVSLPLEIYIDFLGSRKLLQLMNSIRNARIKAGSDLLSWFLSIFRLHPAFYFSYLFILPVHVLYNQIYCKSHTSCAVLFLGGVQYCSWEFLTL